MAQQYVQRVDESVYVTKATLIPGLRGRARVMAHYPDYLAEGPIGPIYQVNDGFQFTYRPQRVASFTPNNPSVTTARNGRALANARPIYRFQARRVQELSTHAACS